MMRKSVRIVRLIRRRRFKYRRMHAWRLDVWAVMVVFGAGWLLFPSMHETRRSTSRSVESPQFGIVKNFQSSAEEAVLSPALFAFTAREGFASDVVAVQLDEMGRQNVLVPSIPIHLYQISASEWMQDVSSPKIGLIDLLRLPPPAVWPAPIRAGGTPPSEARVEGSIPGIVPHGHFSSSIQKDIGKAVRICISFGADGRANSAVLFAHVLDAADAARVERAAMRLAGPPGESVWVLIF